MEWSWVSSLPDTHSSAVPVLFSNPVSRLAWLGFLRGAFHFVQVNANIGARNCVPLLVFLTKPFSFRCLSGPS